MKRILFSTMSGLLAGVAASIFLLALDLATRTRDAHPALIWLLPLAGFAMGWVYHHHGKDAARGSNLILDEIHDPQKITPLRMAPLVLIGTVITHLFGGSAGREGTAVQMGASLSDQLTRFFHVSPEERRTLLISGTGAGFGAAMGAPWAGMIFGMEVIRVGRLRPVAILECFIASFVAFFTTRALHAPHTHYPTFGVPPFEWKTVACVVLAGALFGLCARSFTLLTHGIEHVHRRVIAYPPFRPAIAGLILSVFYLIEGSYRYVGLGIPVIQDAIREPAHLSDPLFKGLFSALTVGSGFKGGEFIPLVFLGTTLGSALGPFLGTSSALLAGLGFVGVFAGASNTPIACTVLAMEVFGSGVAPYALLACLLSYAFSGRHGIYVSQRTHSQTLGFVEK